jgi:Holliday junction DNA helicase RuvA
MINSLTGKITFKSTDILHILNNGIEWEILTSCTSLNKWPGIGKEAKVFTYLHHKDDQMKLYGFFSEEERNLFLDLLKVDTVGPRLSIKILSGISAADFIKALNDEDIITLSGVPGLGKKTAQKIILALKGKLKLKDEATQPLNRVFEDIANALTEMGFDKKIALNTVLAVSKDLKHENLSDEDFERELLKQSIRTMSKNA